MSTSWKFLSTITDGQNFEINGLNIWDYRWTSTGRIAEIRDPRYGRERSLPEYEVSSGDTIARFAADEFSNLIWGIFVAQEIGDVLCLRFKMPKDSTSPTDKQSVAFIESLSKFLPAANPDYDDKIKLVTHWIVEFEVNTGLPNREIGLNDADEVIMTLPDKSNYGYWTDNHLKLNDFEETFETKVIQNKDFEFFWSNYSMTRK